MIKNAPIKDGNTKDDLIHLKVGKIITNSFIGATQRYMSLASFLKQLDCNFFELLITGL